MEILDIFIDFNVAKILIWHWNAVIFFQHRFRIRIGFKHFFRGLEPFRQPGVGAPLGRTEHVRAQLVTATDRMAGQALAFKIQLSSHGCRIGWRGRGGHVVVFKFGCRGRLGGIRVEQADCTLRYSTENLSYSAHDCSNVRITPRKGMGAPMIITERTEGRSFTVEGYIPLFRMHFEHTVSPVAGGSEVAHRVWFTGALAFPFGPGVVKQLRESLPRAMRSLKTYAEQRHRPGNSDA